MNSKKFNKRIIVLCIITLVLLLGWILWKCKAWQFLSLEYLERFTGSIRDLRFLGLIIYLAAFTLGTIAFLPSLPFALLGGITYGTIRGIVYASLGTLLGASMAFIIARYIGRKKIEKRLENSKAFHEINDRVERNGWRVLVLTRMVPIIPHWLQNYAYGLTTISFKTYALVSLLCIIPGTTAWIFAINAIDNDQADPKRTILYITLAGILLVISSYLSKWLYKRKKCTDQ